MDISNRRPQLPALSYLDIDKSKRDEEETYQHRASGASQTHSNSTSASSAYQYPPPTYNHPPPQHANSWSGLKSDAQTPPDTRRTSGEEYDNVKQTTRQSLPSISEALGVESQPTSYPPPPPVAQPSSQTILPPPPQSPTPVSKKRPYMEPQHASTSYGANSSYQYPPARQDSAAPHSYPAPDTKPAYGLPAEPRPPLHVQTAQPHERYTSSQNSSPQFEHQSSHSSGSMAPPNFPYGYTPYPPRYASQTSSSPRQNAGPIYQPSSQFAAPPTPSSGWRSDTASSRFESDERSTAPPSYGDSVKRHLDLFDLEAALNEVAQSSGSVADFSRRYGERMHQSARPGPSLANLPSVVEVEDMIAKSRLQADALSKIREVILAQQAAFDAHLAEQRQQHKAFAEGGPQVADRHEEEDGTGGFAGADTKKRRGRAAPPGRCHSCNRAETPEWRRGPDGARTLCNACGLHYAKLTRKQTAATKASVGSSNLRPKE